MDLSWEDKLKLLMTNEHLLLRRGKEDIMRMKGLTQTYQMLDSEAYKKTVKLRKNLKKEDNEVDTSKSNFDADDMAAFEAKDKGYMQLELESMEKSAEEWAT